MTKQTYTITITGKVRYAGTIQLTKEEYDDYEERLKTARGYEAERIAEELADKSTIDLAEDGVTDDLEVDDFELEE